MCFSRRQRVYGLVLLTSCVAGVLWSYQNTTLTYEGAFRKTYDGQLVRLSPLDGPFQPGASSKEYINLLNVTPPVYQHGYRSFCWYESMSKAPTYSTNTYKISPPMYAVTIATRQKLFDTLIEQMKKRFNDGARARLRCLPYFYLIGFPKCGTTDLYEMLTSHTNIHYSKLKENYYWSNGRTGRHKGIPGVYIPIRDYVDILDLAALEAEQVQSWDNQMGRNQHPTLIGDASVHTSYEVVGWENLPENANSTDGPRFHNADYIHHLTPDAKIIMILRNPTERLYSDYIFRGGRSPQQFHFLAKMLIGQMKQCFELHSQWACVNNDTYNRRFFQLTRGIYTPLVKRWLEVFPRNQVYIGLFEEYIKNQHIILNDIFRFLGVELISRSQFISSRDETHANNRDDEKEEVGNILPETKALLDDFFKPLNIELAEFLGDKRFLWNS